MVRWPWSRDKGQPAGEPPVTAQRAGHADAAPSPMGWAFLPPVQRTLSEPIATLTQPASFHRSLPAWTNPSFSGALRHLVSDQAPAGVIDAGGFGHSTGAPLQRVATGVELTLPPPAPAPRTRGRASVQRAVPPEAKASASSTPEDSSSETAPSLPARSPAAAPPAPDQVTTPGAAPSLPHVPTAQRRIQRTAATTRTALTTAPAAGLPVARPRVLDEPPPDLVVARVPSESAAPQAPGSPVAEPAPALESAESPTWNPGDDTPVLAHSSPTVLDLTPRVAAPPDVSTASQSPSAPTPVVSRATTGPGPGPGPAASSAAPTPARSRSALRPSSASAIVQRAAEARPIALGAGRPPDEQDVVLAAPPAEETTAPEQSSGIDLPVNSALDTALLGGAPQPSVVQRSTEAAAPTGFSASDLPTTGTPRGRSGFGPPLASAPDTVSDLPLPLLQRSQDATAAAPRRSTASTPRVDMLVQADVPAERPPGWAGHTEVALPTESSLRTTVPLVSAEVVQRSGASPALAPYDVVPAGTPAAASGHRVPSTLPLPVLARAAATTAPLGEMATSLSRTIALPGPGMPSQTLEVRPARTVLGTPTGGASVMAQRVPAGSPSTLTASVTSTVATPSPSPSPSPSQSQSRSPSPSPSVTPASTLTVQRAITLPDVATGAETAPEPPSAAPSLGAATEAAADAAGQHTGVEPRGEGMPSVGLPEVGGAGAAQAPGGVAGGVEATSSDQLEALAQRLAPSLLRQLTSQLLVDRERHGVRTDQW